jgi:hypothetical protein
VFKKDSEYREILGRIVADMNRAMDEGGMWIWLLNLSLRTQVFAPHLSHNIDSFIQFTQNAPFNKTIFMRR